jgi:hypothetical protein
VFSGDCVLVGIQRDNTFGKQIVDHLSVLWLVGGKDVIEAAIFSGTFAAMTAIPVPAATPASAFFAPGSPCANP